MYTPMAKLTDLSVAIFSYNRGDLLALTLDSVRANLPGAHVEIYDDLSDDPETCAFLENCGCPVHRPAQAQKAQHGGLYTNMQSAYERCETRYLLFLQDDTQVVRALDDADFAQICEVIDADPGRALVHPTFMKRQIEDHLRAEFSADPMLRCYVQNRDPATQKVPYCWADVCLMDVTRMRAAGFQITQGEGENEAQARALLGKMPYLADPFVFYCPEVPTFRNRGRPLSGRLADRLRPAGLYGYHVMDAQQAAALKARDLSIWPFAEDMLRPRDPAVKTPFVYQDFSSVPVLRPLARLEYLRLSAARRLRRWWAAWRRG